MLKFNVVTRYVLVIALIALALALGGCVNAGGLIDRAALNGCDLKEIRAGRSITVVQCHE